MQGRAKPGWRAARYLEHKARRRADGQRGLPCEQRAQEGAHHIHPERPPPEWLPRRWRRPRARCKRTHRIDSLANAEVGLSEARLTKCTLRSWADIHISHGQITKRQSLDGMCWPERILHLKPALHMCLFMLRTSMLPRALTLRRREPPESWGGGQIKAGQETSNVGDNSVDQPPGQTMGNSQILHAMKMGPTFLGGIGDATPAFG